MSTLRIRAHVLAVVCAATTLLGASASYSQQRTPGTFDETEQEMVGNYGCRYQAEDTVWGYQLEREGLLPKLLKFKERLKDGKETYRPKTDQEIQVMVVDCATPDNPMVWSRPRVSNADIVLVTRGYLKQLK